MSDNKFILRLKGQQAPKSVVEIKNDKLVAPFEKVPHSTDVVGGIIDDKDSSVVVAKGAQNWKLDGSSLVVASSLSGDGADYTGEFNVSGSGLWLNATYSLAATIFSAGTKWALKLCGKNLLTTSGQTIGFTLVVKIGNTHITSKTFTVAEGANVFCRQLVIDFSESEQAIIKAQSGDSLTVQLLCSDANASATIYNGMTVFTALQRRVDGNVVVSDKKTFDEIVEDVEDLEEYVDDTFVRLDGTSIMTAPLKFVAGSMRGAVGPYLNGVGFWKINSGGTITQIATLSDSQFLPTTTNAINFGSSSKKWKDLYLVGKAYITTLNNGADLTVPNKSGTLATMSDVELAANSGSQLYSTGVWYAKMYAATVVPTGAQYDGTNYADFSQVDADNNPVIKIYTGASGAWTLTDTITPPAEYNGYIWVTSKIWDIAEQTDQQGGEVLWDHTHRTFTPYPHIVKADTLPDQSGQNGKFLTTNGATASWRALATVATSGSYTDLTNTPTIPTVNNATLTIQKNGTTVNTFTANASSDVTANITVPTKISDLTNDSNFSNNDLSNLTSTGKNLGNWSTNVSNCITEIPQDIKLELSNGSLIFKAGTKAYKGNGTAVTVASDFTWNAPTGYSTNTFVISLNSAGTGFQEAIESNCVSAASNPGSAYIIWYNTTDGKCYHNDWNGVAAECTLPIAIISITNGTGVTAINQVFNGFGYIGSTVFALPGVKALAPNERNSDGTLKNQLITVSSVLTTTNYSTSGNRLIILTDVPILQNDAAYTYNEKENKIYWSDGNAYIRVILGSITVNSSARITYFNIKTAFNAVDYSDWNAHRLVAFQNPTSSNDYKWYRKYSDGWVEQGGVVAPTAATVVRHPVTFPVAMADTNYTLLVALETDTNSNAPTYYAVGARTKSTTGFTCYMASNISRNWVAKGIAA